MKKTIAAGVLITVTAMGLTACSGSEGAQPTKPKVSKVWPTQADGTWPTNPCVEEDGPGPCLWIAAERGNGQGRSFWVDADQQAHYFD